MSHHSECASSSSQTDPWSDYRATAGAVLEKYGPEQYRFVDLEAWPDAIPTDNVVLTTTTAGPAVARLDGDAVPDGIDAAAIVQPADYLVPTRQSPLSEIDNVELLSEAGSLIVELFRIATDIIMSPNAEPESRDEMADIVRQLHETHAYPLAAIKERLIPFAQQRGDLPSDH